MTRKVYSQFNPPAVAGEVFTLPSLTDELADESLKTIVERFIAQGAVPVDRSNPDLVIGERTTVDDVEAVFDDLRNEDVSRLDKVEQADVLVTAQRLVEQLQKQRQVKPGQEPIRPKEAPEEKPAYTESKEVQKPQE